MRKVALKRRELIAPLLHNGFEQLGRRATSHVRFRGVVDGQVRFVDVDDSIDELGVDAHGVLHYIVGGQLRFFDGPGGAKAGWTRFFAGEPTIARKAQVSYRPWNR